MSDPLEVFRLWLADAEREEPSGPRACCLSTAGVDDYPNARFVALKAFDRAGFVVTGPTDSRKARELDRIPRAALTFWWATIRRQVRIQGDAQPLGAEASDSLFARRPREARLVAWASRQGAPLGSLDELRDRLRSVAGRFAEGPVPRPVNWGAYAIVPRRMEFMRFRDDRLHERTEYRTGEAGWLRRMIQP